MPNKKSFSRTYILRLILVALSSLTLLGGSWVWHEYHHFNTIAQTRRAEYIATRKQALVDRSKLAVAYLSYQQDTAIERLKREVRERVYEAHAMAETLASRHKVPQQAYKEVRSALTAIRFHGDQGYIFAIKLDGSGPVTPLPAMLIGIPLRDVQDSTGHYFIRESLRVANEEGEGFVNYTFTKPGAQGNDHRKIAFIKRFAPLKWYLGSGLYVAEMEAQIRQEALLWLEAKRYEDGGTLFGYAYSGVSLLGPTKGTNMWETRDTNDVMVVQELIAKAKSGGGFVEYMQPAADRNPSFATISYTLPIAEWDMCIGSEFNTEALESELITLEKDLWSRLRQIIFSIVSIIGIFIAASFWGMRRSADRMDRDLRTFINLFTDAANESRSMDKNSLHFEELDMLADAANTMIAGRDRAEAALRESEKSYRRIFEGMTDGFYRTDMNGILTLANPAAIRMLGYSNLDQVIGLNLATDIYENPDDRQRFLELLHKHNVVTDFQTNVKKVNGEILRVEVNSRIILDEAGTPMGVEGLIRDITQRMRTQELLVQTEKMMSVGGLAAGMAHEINNPLGSILQGAQNIQRRLSPSLRRNEEAASLQGCSLDSINAYMEDRQITRMLAGIRDAGTRAARIVANMLTFSRPGESKHAPCRLEELAETAIELASTDYDLKKKYDFRKVTIHRDYDPELSTVPCSRTEIEQVLLNLLRNAAQAIMESDHPEPAISIRTRKKGKFALIEVADNGPGMSEEIRRRAFEPFYTTKDPGNGTGLGLSVSYFIITRNHGGMFRISSKPGQGARFTILLPLVSQETAPPSPPGA